MAGALLYRTDCLLLNQTSAVATDVTGPAFEINRKDQSASAAELYFVVQVHLDHANAQSGDESMVIIETSADKVFWARVAVSGKCDSIHTSLDEILEPTHILQFVRVRIILEHRDGSDPKARATVHLCSNAPVVVTPVS